MLKQQGADHRRSRRHPERRRQGSEEQLPAVGHRAPGPTTCAARTRTARSRFKYGMKRDFNAWLASLGPAAPVKTLTELRAVEHRARRHAGAIKYGQAQLDVSDEMDLERDRARYEADRAKDIRSRRHARHRRGDEGRTSSTRCSSPAPAARRSPPSPAIRPSIVPFAHGAERADASPFPAGFNAKPAPVRRELHRRRVQRAAADRAGLRLRAGDEAPGPAARVQVGRRRAKRRRGLPGAKRAASPS